MLSLKLPTITVDEDNVKSGINKSFVITEVKTAINAVKGLNKVTPKSPIKLDSENIIGNTICIVSFMVFMTLIVMLNTVKII